MSMRSVVFNRIDRRSIETSVQAQAYIYRIFGQYMASDGDIDSRPAAMSRGQMQQADEEDEMETEDDDEACTKSV